MNLLLVILHFLISIQKSLFVCPVLAHLVVSFNARLLFAMLMVYLLPLFLLQLPFLRFVSPVAVGDGSVSSGGAFKPDFVSPTSPVVESVSLTPAVDASSASSSISPSAPTTLFAPLPIISTTDVVVESLFSSSASTLQTNCDLPEVGNSSLTSAVAASAASNISAPISPSPASPAPSAPSAPSATAAPSAPSAPAASSAPLSYPAASAASIVASAAPGRVPISFTLAAAASEIAAARADPSPANQRAAAAAVAAAAALRARMNKLAPPDISKRSFKSFLCPDDDEYDFNCYCNYPVPKSSSRCPGCLHSFDSPDCSYSAADGTVCSCPGAIEALCCVNCEMVTANFRDSYCPYCCQCEEVALADFGRDLVTCRCRASRPANWKRRSDRHHH